MTSLIFATGIYVVNNTLNFSPEYCLVSKVYPPQIHGYVSKVQTLSQGLDQYIVTWEGVDSNGNPITLKLKSYNQLWKNCIRSKQ